MDRIRQDQMEQMEAKLGKIQFPDVLFLHCILHQQAFCQQQAFRDNLFLNMSAVLDPIITALNFIRDHASNHSDFIDFLDDMDREFGGTPYNVTKLSWLSCSRVLSRFSNLQVEIFSLLDENNAFNPLVTDREWSAKLAFLIDMTTHIDDLNLKLQDKNNLISDF